MAKIVPMPRSQHLEAQQLLPWYVTGRLDAADLGRVEAHVSECSLCQAELQLERRLEVEVASLPLDVEQGWTSMLRRVQASPSGRSAGDRAGIAAFRRRTGGLLRSGAGWLGWALAAGVTAVLVTGPLIRPASTPAPYHALAAPRPAAAGNVIVVFRPDTTERAIRRLLRTVDARLTDGPTAADAYVLQAPSAGRARALVALRARREVVLAEPLDPGGAP